MIHCSLSESQIVDVVIKDLLKSFQSFLDQELTGSTIRVFYDDVFGDHQSCESECTAQASLMLAVENVNIDCTEYGQFPDRIKHSQRTKTDGSDHNGVKSSSQPQSDLPSTVLIFSALILIISVCVYYIGSIYS